MQRTRGAVLCPRNEVPCGRTLRLDFLDQGSSKFESLDVLACAMDTDPELRVLVTARCYDAGCCFKAISSGALDYLEAPLTAPQISGLVDMFVPRPSNKH